MTTEQTQLVASAEEKAGRNIYQRMHAVMLDISYVQKSDKKVNEQYRFVTHDAVTAKVREALVTHGIVALTDVAQHAQDGNRTSADVSVTFVNIDHPEDRVTVRAFGYGIDPQDKGPGKAISYAVKYAYLKAFALETGDDPERDSIDHAPAKPTAPAIDQAHLKPARKKPEEVFAEMPPEAQNVTREWAIEVIDIMGKELEPKADRVDRAARFVLEKTKDGSDQEGLLALSSQLESYVRNPIKARMQAIHHERLVAGVKKVPLAYASQP